MKKPKEYKIETFTDIVNATTPENIDAFLVDLKHALEVLADLKQLAEPGEDITPYIKPFFVWVDDGKHHIDIELKTT